LPSSGGSYTSTTHALVMSLPCPARSRRNGTPLSTRKARMPPYPPAPDSKMTAPVVAAVGNVMCAEKTESWLPKECENFSPDV